MTESVKVESLVGIGVLEDAQIRVLHVDDESGFLKVAKQILETKDNFKVDTASSVEEAIKKLEVNTYDVILSDYQMPGKDGLEFLKELRESDNDVPFIMFTGRGREEVAIKALNLGADQYLHKSGTPETVFGELTHNIRKAVSRKKAEKKLRESEEEHRALLSMASMLVQSVNPEGKFVYVNREWERVLGYTENDLKDISMMDVIRKDYHQHCMGIFKQVMEGHTVRNVEAVFVTKDGRDVVVRGNAMPRFKDGKFVATVGFFSDITERKKTEQALQDANEKWVSLMENTDDVIMILDGIGTIQYLNSTPLATNPEETIGESVYEYVPRDQHDVMRKSLRKVFKTGKPDSYEVSPNIQGIDTIWFSTKVVPIKHDRKTVSVMLISTDITERKGTKEKRNKLLHDYGERIKELRCLFGLSKLVEKPNISKEEILQGTNDLLQSAWQYPDVTCSRIIFENREFKTENFKETPWKQSSDIKIKGKKAGVVEVYYLEEKPTITKGPFLKEERALLDTVTERLGRIIERKKADKTLQKNAEDLRNLLSSIDDLVFVIGLDGTFKNYYQPSRGEDFYIPPEEFIGKYFRDVLPPYVAGLLQDAIKKVETSDETQEFDYYLEMQGGKKWSNAKILPMKDLSGHTTSVIVVVRNINKRKQTEEKLSQSEKKYRNIVELSPDGLAVMNMKGFVTSINPAFSKLTGFSKEELVGKHFTKLGTLRMRDLPMYLKLFRSMIGGRLPDTTEFTYVRKDGSVRLGDARCRFLVENGKRIGVQAVLRDITERKKMEEELRKSERQASAAIEAARAFTFSYDIATGKVDWGGAIEEITGYTREEFAEVDIKEWADRIHPDDREEVLSILQKAMGKERATAEYRFKVKKRYITLSSISLTEKQDGKTVRLVGILQDITERKQEEESVNKTLVKLKELKEKLEVVGSLTRHDLRNKLSTMLGRIYLAKEKLTESHDARIDLDVVQSSISEAERILDFARLYETLGIEELTYVNVSTNIKEAISLLPEAQSKLQGIKISDENQGLMVLADSLLRQFFYNLIHNSIIHGETVRQITFRYSQGKDSLKLIYEDDGIGISKAEKEKIFKEGYGKGTGYGLYLIMKMCEVYGWTIKETGKQGKGVQFTVTIPRTHGSGREGYKLP